LTSLIDIKKIKNNDRKKKKDKLYNLIYQSYKITISRLIKKKL